MICVNTTVYAVHRPSIRTDLTIAALENGIFELAEAGWWPNVLLVPAEDLTTARYLCAPNPENPVHEPISVVREDTLDHWELWASKRISR